MIGKVKWYNNARGIGYVVDEKGNEILFDYLAVLQSGFATVRSGQLVDYTVIKGAKGEKIGFLHVLS